MAPHGSLHPTSSRMIPRSVPDSMRAEFETAHGAKIQFFVHPSRWLHLLPRKCEVTVPWEGDLPALTYVVKLHHIDMERVVAVYHVHRMVPLL